MSTKPEFYTNEIIIPDGVSMNKDQNLITANGSNGKVQKDFTKIPALIEVDKEKITIRWYQGNRKSDFALVNTVYSLITNMIKGSTIGFTYKLKIVFAHFSHIR